MPVHAHRQGVQAGLQDGFWQIGPAGRKPRLGRRVPDRENEVGAGKSHQHGFAQGAGGQAEPVAEPHGGINHHKRQILDHVGVLKTVIHQDDIRARRLGQTHGGGAVAADEGRGKGRQQQGLVANLGGGMAGFDHLQRSCQRAAVTAADHGDLAAFGGEPRDQGDGRWRLAGTADIQIADADHRQPRPVAGARHPARGGGRVGPAERRQQARHKTGVIGRV